MIELEEALTRLAEDKSNDWSEEIAVIREAVDTARLHPAPAERVVPGPLRKADSANFDTLLRAVKAGDAVLLSAIRKRDGKQVALVCAAQPGEDDTIEMVPFAVMVEGDPYEEYEDPTV